ncbi:hypothetical protein ACJROX_07020 [Pseudalkalibacillus sp. A8]|uniref:hypothetical protein n=1 Tax=Pseudalkalibacillus sp. A8 TaxID=3382641 RepID=UPI0038B4E448
MNRTMEQVLVHPDGTTITLLDQGTDEQGEYLIVEHLVIKRGTMNGPHWHPVLTESFTVKEGMMGFIVDGTEQLLAWPTYKGSSRTGASILERE